MSIRKSERMLRYFQRIGDELGLTKIKSILQDTSKANVAEYEALEDYYYRVRAERLETKETTSDIIDAHDNFNHLSLDVASIYKQYPYDKDTIENSSSLATSQPILGAFELELASLTDSEKQELEYPNAEVVSFAKKFLLSSPNASARFVRASEDGRGGLVLVFSKRLAINISKNFTLFVCPNFGEVKSIYASHTIQQLIESYFD